jgi:hypothetical protein
MQQAEVLNPDPAEQPGVNDTGLTQDEGELHGALACCAPFSCAADLAFGEPFVNGSTGESRQSAR